MDMFVVLVCINYRYLLIPCPPGVLVRNLDSTFYMLKMMKVVFDSAAACNWFCSCHFEKFWKEVEVNDT